MDWRITNQEEYVGNAKLKKVLFASKPNWDHEHCIFCWEKIGEKENEIHEAYCTLNEEHWICPKCFSDFKEEFHWTIEEE